jgi:hypothetical protein
MVNVSGRIYWLWCCVGVLLAGCGQVFSGNATRTPMLAFLNLPRPTISPTGILRLIRTPSAPPSGETAISNATPAPLASPNCYETPVGSLWCLGIVRNNRDGPVTDLIVHVYLVNAAGEALADKQINIPRKLLQPNDESPYGALFEAAPETAVGSIAYLVASTPAANSVYSTRIGTDNVQSTAQDGLFHVSARLTNQDAKRLTDVSVIATAFDGKGRVTGYRQLPLGADKIIEPGANVSVAFDLAPQGLGTTRVEVSAEGRIK